MSGFFWNMRGFNKLNKQTVVRDWIRFGNLSFGCLIETRVRETKSEVIFKSVFPDWSLVTNYEYSRRGRIWVVSDPSVKITILSKSAQAITCLVKLENLEEFCCSFVYASNFVEDRKLLWADLITHKNTAAFSNMAWLCFGDFNEILDLEEHSVRGGSSLGMPHFQEMVQRCMLTDMNWHGPLFTWNNRQTENLISKKLDRCLINDVGLDVFPNAYCVFESGGCSDHLRGRFHLTGEITKVKGPFKFVNAVTSSHEFIPTISDFWENSEELFSSTSSLFRFSKKLKELKPALKDLGRRNVAQITVRTREALEDLKLKQEASLLNPSPENNRAVSIASERWERASQLEEKFLRQRSKIFWLKVGDQNSKAFYSAITARRARNAIREIISPDGATLTSQTAIKDEAVRFFSDFLQQEPNGYVGLEVNAIRELLGVECTETEQLNLAKEVSAEEIRKVIFSMPKEKAPGPDGYTVEFFKAAWPIIGKECEVAVESFFRYGFLPKGLNSTILALIPKKEEAKVMKDYRPISCCNVLYKVISKILANRLKGILHRFIVSNQSAFVRGRLLMENLLLATELVKNYHRDDVSPRCAMMIDISKAFDSVQWPFLLNTLSAMNIPPCFIRWIELCVSTASFSVQVNGELAGFFQSKRGLRQGCSLSPYLFVICMNILSKMLDKSADDRRIGTHPGCSNLRITHLCFADDLLVFNDGSMRSMEGVLNVFNEFEAASGLKISLEKSQIFMAGMCESQRQAILSAFPFEPGTLPVRYLGLPLTTKRMTVSDYSPLIQKIKNRIGSWTNRFLSFAGRLQLLQSVIASLTNFWLSAFRLPKACIVEIMRISSAFLWSGPDLNPRKAKIKWEEVCKPKDEGGLGLKNLVEVNKVCMLKLIWRILSARSLWVDWVQRELVRSSSFWTIPEGRVAGSWMWRKILKYRDLAKDFHRVEIHDGRSASFWHDRWSALGVLFTTLGPRGFIDLGLSSDATVADAVSLRGRRHRQDFLIRVSHELDVIRTRGLTTQEDVAVWRGVSGAFKHSFSTKETWDQLRNSSPKVDWHSGVWFSKATPKFSFVVWLAAKNRLSTGDRMRVWNVAVNPKCCFCNAPMESRDHLFFDCAYSREIWLGLMGGLLSTSYSHSWRDLIGLLTGNALDAKTLFLLRYCFQCVVHTIWLERNQRRHGGLPSPPQSIIQKVDRQCRNRFSSLAGPDSKYRDSLQLWFATRS